MQNIAIVKTASFIVNLDSFFIFFCREQIHFTAQFWRGTKTIPKSNDDASKTSDTEEKITSIKQKYTRQKYKQCNSVNVRYTRIFPYTI